MRESFEQGTPSDPYGDVPPPSDPDEGAERQLAERERRMREAEEAFLTTLRTNRDLGISMPEELLDEYQRKLGKSRVAELIREDAQVGDLFSVD